MASIRETFNNWLVFYLLIILSWLAVLVMGVAETFSADIAFMTIVKEICSSSVLSVNIFGLFLMWVLMSVAMMAPTIIPTLITYQDLLVAGAKKKIASGLSFWVSCLFGFFSR